MVDKTGTSFEPSDPTYVFMRVGNTSQPRRFSASSVSVSRDRGSQRSLVHKTYDTDLEKDAYQIRDWRSNTEFEIILEGPSQEGLNGYMKVRLNYNDAKALAQNLVDMMQQTEESFNNATVQELLDVRNTLDAP
jgi:hypothetical protein